MGISNGIVFALGIGIVFLGLIAIVAICYIMGFLCKVFIKQENKKPTTPVASAAQASGAPIANKQEIIAATCAVIAEELGTDVSNIRVTSFKRI